MTLSTADATVLWGDIIHELRQFHLDLIQLDPKIATPHSPDYTLYSNAFPFPESSGDYDDWSTQELPQHLERWIEFHPVERALLEGPLLPIQKVFWPTPESFSQFCSALLELEQTWSKEHHPPVALPLGWEQELHRRLLRVQSKRGIRHLRRA